MTVGHFTETILVVARDGGFRRKIVDVLDGDGYATIEAGDAREARRVREEHDGAIDLILTTIRLASSPRRHGDLPLRRAGTRVIYVLEPDGEPMATFEVEYGDLVLASGFTAYELRAMVRGALDAFVLERTGGSRSGTTKCSLLRDERDDHDD